MRWKPLAPGNPAVVLVAALVVTLAAAMPASPASNAHAGPAQAGERQTPLLEGMGSHHRPVTTDSSLAQRYFDQALVLAFGFNYPEAHRSFLEATRIDPGCAMCWWGASWVLGPNINAVMDPANAPEAWRLLQRAQDAAENATVRERAWIAALAERYGPEALDDRSSRDHAYAEAMGELAERFPDDLDARVLHAEALMITTPWDYWQDDGTAKPVTETILAGLDGVLDRDPDHPFANHLYIHAVEAQHPEWGLEEAARLEDLVPGAGHLQHMPSHIYIRVGRYHDATRANQKAVEADRRYLEQVAAQGEYRAAYVPHNFHFMWATATLEGREELALRAAREMADMVDREAMRQRGLTTLQHYWITPLYAMVRFGHWDEILEHPEPADDLVYPRAVRHYARGMALTRKGRLDEAREELERLETLADDPSLEWVTVWDINRSRHILAVASGALAGELALAAGDVETAIAALRRAVEHEDALNYDEPPTWHYPVRQSLGVALLQAGRAADAEAVYRADLEVFPENGWSLFGLMEALRRQGKVEEARDVERRFREAWRHADVTLTASRF